MQAKNEKKRKKTTMQAHGGICHNKYTPNSEIIINYVNNKLKLPVLCVSEQRPFRVKYGK